MVRLEPLAESYDRASGPEHRTPRPNGPCPSHEHPSNKLVSPATQLELDQLAKHMTQESWPKPDGKLPPTSTCWKAC